MKRLLLLVVCYAGSIHLLTAQVMNLSNNAWNDENFNASNPTTEEPSLKWLPSKGLNAEFFLPILSIETEELGRKNGILKGFDAEGHLYFKTTYSKGNINGTWKSQHRNGKPRDEGSFYKNVPDGEWKGYYPNGQLKYVRQYSAQKWYAMKSQLKRRNPKQQYFTLVDMAMKNAHLFGTLASARYSFQTLAEEASYYVPPFVNCLHHGIYMNYYQNGVLKDSGSYHEGLRNGVWQSWYPNGAKQSSGIYINGEKHSGWISYNEEGEMIWLREYRFGKLMYEKHYELPL
jgi:antitoxin component YwqK of YwqJK toxin-antitoxin module